MTIGRGKGKQPKANDECSNEAFALKSNTVAAKVLDYITKAKLTTCDRAELDLNMSHRYGRKANLYRPVYRDTLFEL